MKKIIPLIILMIFTKNTLSSQNLGFELSGSFYSPIDSRYSATSTGMSLNIKVDTDLTMGFKTEEYSVKAEESGVSDTHNITVQTIFAYYSLYKKNEFSVDTGIGIGNANTSDFNATATITPLTSPVIEVSGKISFFPKKDKIQPFIFTEISQKFIRQFTVNNPFGGTSKRLNNFDGLNIKFGIGIWF
ncbi:MAG: hypothetical protein N2Z20_03880 [Elusimicrobiales bacterium]|nr:hypothetical protein [Elusimicrobiales bacterium]